MSRRCSGSGSTSRSRGARNPGASSMPMPRCASRRPTISGRPWRCAIAAARPGSGSRVRQRRPHTDRSTPRNGAAGRPNAMPSIRHRHPRASAGRGTNARALRPLDSRFCGNDRRILIDRIERDRPSPRPSPRRRGEGALRHLMRLARRNLCGVSAEFPSPRKRGEGQGEGLAAERCEGLLAGEIVIGLDPAHGAGLRAHHD